MANLYEKPIWVLGTKVPGLKCIDWISGDIPNFADCGTVIIDTRSLIMDTLKLLTIKRMQELQIEIKNRFIAGGNIICILDEIKANANNENYRITNDFWSPIDFVPRKVKTGEGYRPDPGFGFESYLKKMESWNVQIQQFGVSGITQRQGETLQVHTQKLINTADDGRIGGIFTVDSQIRNSGTLVALPKILDPDEAIKTILEVLGVYEKTPPPNWSKSIKVTGIDELEKKLKPKLEKMEQIKKEIQDDRKKIQDLEKFKKLLYATDKELESIVKDSLTFIGLKNAREGRAPEKEDLLLDFNGTDFNLGVIEVKGVQRSVVLDDFRQADEWVWDYKSQSSKAKGIVIANCYRLEDPTSSHQKRMEFSNMDFCRQHEISVLPTWTLFQLVQHKLEGKKIDISKIENVLATKNDVITIEDLI